MIIILLYSLKKVEKLKLLKITFKTIKLMSERSITVKPTMSSRYGDPTTGLPVQTLGEWQNGRVGRIDVLLEQQKHKKDLERQKEDDAVRTVEDVSKHVRRIVNTSICGAFNAVQEPDAKESISKIVSECAKEIQRATQPLANAFPKSEDAYGMRETVFQVAEAYNDLSEEVEELELYVILRHMDLIATLL